MKSATITSPLDDLTYDIVSIIQKKAEGLEAYEKYMKDAQQDEEVMELLEEMRSADVENIQALKEILANRLEEDLDASAPDDDSDEDEDEDDAEPVGSGGLLSGGMPPRRGESTSRR